MFVLGNFIIALAKVVDIVLIFYYWLILIRALLSWVSPDPFNPIVQFLYRATEPVLEPVRRILPSMAIDISPMVVFLVIIFLQNFLVSSLMRLGWQLQG